MRKPDCHNCARAAHGSWKRYSDDCAECNVRWIADVDSSQREAVYDQIAAQVPASGLARIRELVGEEIQRRKLLREGAKGVM